MIYHPRTPQEAVNLRKEHADTAVYLAGGTDDLRLGGAAEGKNLIDITGFDFNTALTAADAVLKSITPHGEQDKPVGEYLQSDCKRLIEYVVVDKDRTGSVKRFGNTSSSHATLIAAESGGIYALSVQGSGLVYGTTPDIAEQVTYVDDLTGSAAYKKYLAGIVFTLGR